MIKVGSQVLQIKSSVGAEGAIGEVIQYMGCEPLHNGLRWYKGQDKGLCWLVRFPRRHAVTVGLPQYDIPLPQSWLRPVSGIDGENNDSTVCIQHHCSVD